MSINRLMDKEMVVHITYTMECYSAIKRNIFESVLVRWMNLEPVIQSEVSQKEKNEYDILTIHSKSRKLVLMNLIAMEKQT